MNQEEWTKKNFKQKRPWVCKCNRDAFLHTCIKDKHEFWCKICVEEYNERNGI
jgi:hypothetical protein